MPSARFAVPEPIDSLARRRSLARAERDWAAADGLRREIEQSGWKVVDDGLSYRLEPAHPPDLVEPGGVRYGSSTAVPSRLDQPEQGLATVVLTATDWSADLRRAVVGLGDHAPAGTSVVIVADDPSGEQAEALEGTLEAGRAALGAQQLEVIWTSARLGAGAALAIGLRRSVAPVVISLDTSIEPDGDIVTSLVQLLADPSIAVAGPYGVTSADMRHFEAASAGDVHAVEGYCLAFRRADGAARGPIDERFRFYRNLDLWWSLVLRDDGPGALPRRAVAIELPVVRHEHRAWFATAARERERLSKRNFYRIIDRFGKRLDLVDGDQPPRGER